MLEDLRIEEKGDACIFGVKVTPRSSKNLFTGIEQGLLKLRVTAPPVEGEANKAICAFLADLLNLPKKSISILRGDASRRKLMKVESLPAAEIRRRLSHNK
jgi:uncharacterized protein (TIGR00251 family)